MTRGSGYFCKQCEAAISDQSGLEGLEGLEVKYYPAHGFNYFLKISIFGLLTRWRAKPLLEGAENIVTP